VFVVVLPPFDYGNRLLDFLLAESFVVVLIHVYTAKKLRNRFDFKRLFPKNQTPVDFFSVALVVFLHTLRITKNCFIFSNFLPPTLAVFLLLFSCAS
jgi:hypothetical protein